MTLNHSKFNYLHLLLAAVRFFPKSQHLCFWPCDWIKAESVDHSWWVWREMFGPGWHRRQAFIGGFGAGAAVICGSVVGGAIIGSDGRLVIDRISSWREVSQLNDDVFPPSNYCWITLHLGTTKDLLLAWMASVTVFHISAWDPAVWAVSWLGEGIHNISWRGSSTNHYGDRGCHCCRIFSLSGKREGRAWEQICLLSLAGRHPGWRDEGGAARPLWSCCFADKGHLFYSAMLLIQNTTQPLLSS
jgi:hypothetical protein